MNADGNHRKRNVSEKEEPSTTSAEYSRGERRTPPSHSVFFRITSDSSDEDTNEDNNFGSNRSPFSDNVKGKSSLSQWWSEVLKECKISYEEKPTPFEKFMKEVKDGINIDVNLHCPDTKDLISFCTDCIKENLKFSFDLKNVRDMRKDMMLVRQKKKKKIIAEINNDIKKTEETAKHLDKANYFYSFWDRAMVELLEETKLLIHTVMNADPEEHKVVGMKRRKVGHCATVIVERDKSFFQSYCEMFGRIFFLKERYLPVETFLFRNKTVKSNPDVTYRFYPDPSLKEEGATSLLFITKVKDSTVKTNTIDAPLEEQVGLKVMGQVGSKLIAASKTSVFWPNSLGIICMETKLIFVFLKQSQDHYRSIALDEPGPIDGEGKISYSQPFDMLNADDRQKMADLLFWLGCIQDYKNYKFI